MSRVYDEQPNIVKVVFSDESGHGERFVVGKDLDTVLAEFETAFNATSAPRAVIAKPHRKRRTKAELSAANGAAKQPVTAGATWPE